MKFVRPAAILASLLVIGAGQDPSDYTVKPSLELTRDDFGRHIFTVRGTTNLPDGARLEVSLNAVGKTNAQGEREEKWVSSETAVVAAGKFSIEMIKFSRKPFPFKYEASVVLTRDDQPEALQRLIGRDDEMTATCAIGEYDEKAMKAEIKAVRKTLHEDFTAVDTLYKEFKESFTTCLARKENGLKEWTAWSGSFIPRVDAALERNNKRIGLWIVRTESRGKHYVEGMCRRLQDFLQIGEKIIRGNPDDNGNGRRLTAEDMREMMAEFETVYAEYFGQMDFVDLIDTATIRPAIDEMKKIADTLEAALKKPDAAEWTKTKEETGGRIMEEVFRLTSLLPESMTDRIYAIAESYAAVTSLGDRIASGDQGLETAAKEQIASMKETIGAVMKDLEKARE